MNHPATHCISQQTKLRSDSAASPLWCLPAELLMRAARIIASYESSAWQVDSSGFTAKPGDYNQITHCHGVAKSKSFTL